MTQSTCGGGGCSAKWFESEGRPIRKHVPRAWMRENVVLALVVTRTIFLHLDVMLVLMGWDTQTLVVVGMRELVVSHLYVRRHSRKW